MFLSLCVCVCLSAGELKKCPTHYDETVWREGRMTSCSLLDFGGDTDHSSCVDLGVFQGFFSVAG